MDYRARNADTCQNWLLNKGTFITLLFKRYPYSPRLCGVVLVFVVGCADTTGVSRVSSDTPSPGLAVGPLFEASASTAVSSTNCTNTGTATAGEASTSRSSMASASQHLFGEAEGNVGPTSEPPNGLIPTVRRLPHRDEKVGVGDVEWPTCRQCRRCRRRLALVSSSRSAHRRRAGGLAE